MVVAKQQQQQQQQQQIKQENEKRVKTTTAQPLSGACLESTKNAWDRICRQTVREVHQRSTDQNI